MAEETKFIVTELNTLLNKNYNISTFENLSKDEILQIVCDVLTKLNVIVESEAQKNPDNAIIIILDALQSIKYSPPKSMNPDEFREGISLGNRSVIRPILYWLLSNPEKVKKRAYLSKYVDKVECPPEMLDDVDVRILRSQYENLIEEFWKVYTENQKEKKNALEAKELQSDVEKMEEDTAKLTQRIEQQKEKFDNISNKEMLFALVRNYRNEINEEAKLEQQLTEQKELEREMEKQLNELMNYKQNHKMNHNPLEQVFDELRYNNVIIKKLPEDLDAVRKESELYESVLKDPEPTTEELNSINSEIDKLNKEIELLKERKTAIDSNPDTQLGAFRNQASIIQNKKKEISDSIIEVQSKLNTVNAEIAEKEEILTTLVGGPLLQGDNLNKYVTKLRERNVLYKECKNQFRVLTTELGILTRTVDILKSIDPSVEEMLKKRQSNKINNIEEQIPDDTSELKIRIKKITSEIDQARAKAAQSREELRSYTTEMQPFLNEYNHAKEKFDEITKEAQGELDKINAEISFLEDEIKLKEEKWKVMHQDNERKEELLIRLNEDIVNSTDELNSQPTQADILSDKLEQYEKTNKKLKQDLNNLKLQKAERKEDLIVLDGIIKLMKAKADCPFPY